MLAAAALASRKSAPAVRGRLLVRRSFLPKSVKAASPTPPLANVLSGRSMESLPVGMSSLAASSATLTPPAEDQDLSPPALLSVVWVGDLTTEIPTAVGMSSARVPRPVRRCCRSSSAPASSRLRSCISGMPLCRGGMATGVWASLAGKDDDMDEHELAPMRPVATQCSSLAAQSMGREGEQWLARGVAPAQSALLTSLGSAPSPHPGLALWSVLQMPRSWASCGCLQRSLSVLALFGERPLCA